MALSTLINEEPTEFWGGFGFGGTGGAANDSLKEIPVYKKRTHKTKAAFIEKDIKYLTGPGAIQILVSLYPTRPALISFFKEAENLLPLRGSIQ
jgi:hypothetical protein